MDARLDQAAGESGKGVAGINSNGAVHRLHPLPLSLGVEDLEGGDGLAEEEGEGAEVSVPGDVQVGDLLVVLEIACCVVHVPQVVFALDVVQVVLDKLLLVGELEQDCEEAEELYYDFLVAFL